MYGNYLSMQLETNYAEYRWKTKLLVFCWTIQTGLHFALTCQQFVYVSLTVIRSLGDLESTFLTLWAYCEILADIIVWIRKEGGEIFGFQRYG